MANSKNIKTLGDFWSDSWELYTKNFKNISLFSIILSIPTAILMLFMEVAYTTEQLKADIGYYIIFFVIMVVVNTLMYAGLINIIYEGSKGKKLNYFSAIKYSFTKFLPMLGTSLLMMVFLIGLFILLIVPGIIFSVFWGFALQAVIIKGLSGKDALDQSKSVVKGRWWKALGYSIVFCAVPVIIAVILSSLISHGSIGEFAYYLLSPIILAFVYVAQTLIFLDWDKHPAKK